jgi:hypothetical protein
MGAEAWREWQDLRTEADRLLAELARIRRAPFDRERHAAFVADVRAHTAKVLAWRNRYLPQMGRAG